MISELELESPRPRRNSFDLGENACMAEAQQLVVEGNEQAVAAAGLVVASGMTKYENQESGFTHRRYTTDSVKRNEMSNEKLLLTKQKIQQEWVGEQPIVRDPVVVAVVEQEAEEEMMSRPDDQIPVDPVDVVDMLKEDGKSKKKRRKKSIMKKKNSQRKNSSSSSNGSAGSESTILGKDTDSSSSLPTPVASLKDTADSSVVVVVPNSTPDTEGFKPIKPERQQSMRDIDMHFFSDTEVTSNTGRNNSDRPSTPVLSDTEFEISQRSSQSEAGQAGTPTAAWKWGELPTPTGGDAVGDASKTAVGQRKSMLTAMFSFMQQNRKGDGGLYLSDLDAEGMDPEVAALYFPEQRNKKSGDEEELEEDANGRTIKYPSSSGGGIEDDRESGNGTSLPHSPSSVELGGSSKMAMMDSDLDESRERNLECIALSTCGGLEAGEPSADEFDKYLVTYSEVRLIKFAMFSRVAMWS